MQKSNATNKYIFFYHVVVDINDHVIQSILYNILAH